MSPVRLALAALVAVQLLFGTLPVAGKLALPALGAGGVVGVRVVGAALLFHLVRPLAGVPPLPRALMGKVIGLSVLGISANQLLYMYGLARTSAAHAALITTTIPLLTELAGVALGRSRLSGRRGAGIAVAFAGVAVLVASGDGAGVATPLGDLLVLANATVYALYLVLSRDVLAEAHPLSVLPWLFTWGAVPVLLVAGPPPLTGQPPEVLAGAVWLVLGPTVGTYGLNLYALRHVPASTVAMFIYLQPIVAAILAIPLLGERLTPATILSAIVTFAGVWLATAPGADGNRRVRGP